MRHTKGFWQLVTLGLMTLVLGATSACAGISQEQYDAAKKEAADLQTKASVLQQQLSTKVQEASSIQQKLSDKEKQAADLETKLKAAEARPGVPAGGSLLLAAKPVPPPPPRPTPTPAPAGFVPPPPPSVPAAFLEPLKLYIYADTVTAGPAESKFNIDAAGIPNASCVLTGVFKRGMHMVWRYEIVDASTGKRLTDKEIDTAVVRLPSGDEIKGRFGRHGSTADAPWFWTSAWDVPLDYPLGALDWSINTKSKDGKTGTFALWKVSIPARGIESRTQIVE